MDLLLLLISRIPCLGSGSRTGGMSAFVAHSCLVFAACCLVDTLDTNPYNIHMMRPSPAHTRTRTLQGRLGTHQDGSSSVRSTGRHADEVIPDLRQNGDEEKFEGDYSDELKRLETFVKGEFTDNDYDLEMSEDGDERAEISPAAERLSGGADRFQIYGREQRGSATMSTDMLAEIESRSFDANPVKEMATPIESTRRGLPQLFGLDGQTGPPQAQSEVKQSTTEKELQLQSLAHDLLSELKALKSTVYSMEATHEKEVEAIHESYKRVISMRPSEDKGKSMRAMMDDKVPIKVLKRNSAVQVENSLYNVKGALEQMGLLNVAEGEVVGSTDDEMRIKRLILRWIGDDERMLSSMRTKLGQEAKGTILLEHIITYYIEPVIGDARSAETKFQAFDYLAMFGGDEENMHECFDKFVNIVSHLSAKRQGDSAEWVQHLSDRVPAELYTEYDRFLRTLTTSQQRMACEDVTAFALYLGKALTRLRERMPPPALKPASVEPAPAGLSAHQQKQEGRLERLPDVIPGHPRLVDSSGKAFNACPDCAFKACPKANNPDGICDVCGEVSESRAAQIAKNYTYKEKVDKKRVLFSKKAIVYVGMKVSVHCDDLSNEDYAALVESLVDEEDDVEAEFSMYKCQMIKDGTYYAKPAN